MTATLWSASGRLDVYQRGGDSLFGRYALYRLHPFTLGELLRPDRISVLAPGQVAEALAEPAAAVLGNLGQEGCRGKHAHPVA